eukprot:1230562-Pyramimonas_sp.AAC.1
MPNNEYAPAVHAPAHRKLEDIGALPAPDRWIGPANGRADREAKRALELHPRPSQAEEDDLKRSIQYLEMVARLAAAVSPIFHRAVHRRPPQRERVHMLFQKAAGWHAWGPWMRGHRCSSCLTFCSGSWSAARS